MYKSYITCILYIVFYSVAYQSISVSFESLKVSHENFCVNLQFIHITQKIQTMISIKSPAVLLDNCKRLKASKMYVVPLFEDDYLKVFSTMTDKPAILFQAMGIFWTWSDHSILKELLHMGQHTEPLNLLKNFDRHLENLKSIPIQTFPLPIVSRQMIPLDTNKQSHTILAIKYKNSYDECTWQNIYELRSLLKGKFKITRNALQLLGILNNDSEFMLIYWMIPTSVIPLITSQIASCDLQSTCITEVAIYPKALFSADAHIKVGPLAFFNNISSETMKVSIHLALLCNIIYMYRMWEMLG